MFRLLIVENDELFARALARIIEQRIALITAIDIAPDFEAALRLIMRQPDVITLDVSMFAAILELGYVVKVARSMNKAVFVVLISGLTYLELASIAWSSAPNDWMCKPVRIDDLAHRIARWIEANAPTNL